MKSSGASSRWFIAASILCGCATAAAPVAHGQERGDAPVPDTVNREAPAAQPSSSPEDDIEPVEATPSELPPSSTGTNDTPTAAPTPPPEISEAHEPLPKPIYSKIDASCGNGKGVGTKLKPFRLHDLEGKELTEKSFRGRVLLVNFWSTWCKPCLKELPEFDQLYRRYRKHGLTLVAIAGDEDPTAVQGFRDKRKLAAKLLVGAEAYASEYGNPDFPFSFVVDAGGTIRAAYSGYRPQCLGKLEADLRAQLEARARR